MIKHIVMWKPKKHVAVKPFIGAVRLERQFMDYEA
jgi:hypothetical protein